LMIFRLIVEIVAGIGKTTVFVLRNGFIDDLIFWDEFIERCESF